MPKESSFFVFSSKNRCVQIILLAFLNFFAEEDDGQFEPEEDQVDKTRRMASESPLNKVIPIPEGSSFFIFSKDNK